jgi:hypothetical protein
MGVLCLLSRDDFVNLGIDVGRFFNLRWKCHSQPKNRKGGEKRGAATNGLTELEHSLSRDQSLFVVILNLNVDYVNSAVELATPAEQICFALQHRRQGSSKSETGQEPRRTVADIVEASLFTGDYNVGHVLTVVLPSFRCFFETSITVEHSQETVGRISGGTRVKKARVGTGTGKGFFTDRRSSLFLRSS